MSGLPHREARKHQAACRALIRTLRIVASLTLYSRANSVVPPDTGLMRLPDATYRRRLWVDLRAFRATALA
jgi:hypothetical protein